MRGHANFNMFIPHTVVMLEVYHKEYDISFIIASSQRGWLTLSAGSREIDCKPRIASIMYTNKEFNRASTNYLHRAVLIWGGGGEGGRLTKRERNNV